MLLANPSKSLNMIIPSVWLFFILLSGFAFSKDYHKDHGSRRKSHIKGTYGAKDRDIPFEGEKYLYLFL